MSAAKNDDDPFDDYVATKGWDTSLLRRLMRFVRPHAGLFAKSFLVLFVLFGLDLVGPWLWKRAIDGPVASAVAARASADETGGVADIAPFMSQ